MAPRHKPNISMRRLRSAISTGTHVLHGVDHRSAWMRRLADLISQHTADLGGANNISQSEHVLIRRAAVLTLQTEMMEKRWADASEGEASARQINDYQRLVNTLTRTLKVLGLERRARDIGPTLGDMLREDLRNRERAS